MNSPENLNNDPLVTALPPTTDYITYLTLLEYQLGPHNLSTLNRLLTEDDGTLTKEIGWDLLKIVLPLLQEVPVEAQNCLQIIARRGNPREVVVRVAEELEKLGDEDSNLQNDGTLEQEEDEDSLRTFAGETPRIHLGNMTLDGMPPATHIPAEEPTAGSIDASRLNDEMDDLDVLKFKSLLSMLGILHPRIRTQFPSRFLATSLPASLGAYRRISITNDTTNSFLSLLSKIAEKGRPALPPRVPSVSVKGLAIRDHETDHSNNIPLPDPEASSEADTNSQFPSTNEQAIITKLLQAVMLEVQDEFMTSLQTHESSHMSWTSRLRERFEPGRSIPHKPTDIQHWEQDPDLAVIDTLTRRFSDLAKELKLKLDDEFKTLLRSIDKDGNYDSEESEDSKEVENDSEYPTSPSQIPFPPGGLITLYAYERFIQVESSETVSVGTADYVKLFTSIQNDQGILSKNSSQISPAIEDAVLSLIYRSIIDSPSTQHQNINQPDYFLPTLLNLSKYIITTIHPQLRNEAHNIATKIFHQHQQLEDRINAIKQIFDISKSDPATSGHLKTIVINWLKDEISTYFSSNDHDQGINPIILFSDQDLKTSIFPIITSPPKKDYINIENENQTNILISILSHIPFWIASLNLTFVIFSSPFSRSEEHTFMTKKMLDNAEKWCSWILALGMEEIPAEIYALEDSCRRVRDVL